MRRGLLVWLAAALLSSGVASAQQKPETAVPARRARTLRLLELMHTREQAARGLNLVAASVRQNNPQAAPLLSAEVQQGLVNTLVTMRAQLEEKYLTEEEVEGLIAFFETPLGQKLAESEAAIAGDLANLGPRGQAAVSPVRVGGEVKEPRKLRNVNPIYPEDARKARLQGVVVLECTINPDGTVGEVKVIAGVPLLNDAAIAAVRQWVYEATLLNGVAVPVIMTVTMTFRLS